MTSHGRASATNKNYAPGGYPAERRKKEDIIMAIYYNDIGHPEPIAVISCFGSVYGRGGYLVLHTTSNNPDNGKRWGNTPEAITDIRAWAEAHGYDITEGRDGYGAYKAQLTHRETARALGAIKAVNDAVFTEAERGYIRLGDVPACVYSRNRATGQAEAGVSVFDAEIAPGGRWRPILSTPQQLGSYLSLLADDRPVYRVYGDVVGRGGDGEPVMRVKRIERLK